jgi:hypothetical protein
MELIRMPSPSVFVLAIYATCGGILICCLETQLKVSDYSVAKCVMEYNIRLRLLFSQYRFDLLFSQFLRVIIAVNYGFLFNSVWRFLFYLLLSSVCWSYGSLFGKIVAGCLAGCAVFNTYVLCA